MKMERMEDMIAWSVVYSLASHDISESMNYSTACYYHIKAQ